jgi:hypothetical protein
MVRALPKVMQHRIDQDVCSVEVRKLAPAT